MTNTGDAFVWNRRSAGYAWWVAIVMGLALTLSLMDRMIISLMIQPIKHDLKLTDTQISMLQGLAFTLLYVIAGLPLGRVADRWNRRAMAAFSVLAWSAMTAVCGQANSFSQLFAARLGVGVGEAGLSPAALSLISDYFPRHKRTRPLAFLSIGVTAGAGLAMMFGGAMVNAVGATGRIRIPIFGVVRGWQAVFMALGACGILFCGILFAIREPVRHERAAANGANVAQVVAFLWARKRFFIAQFLGPSFSVLTLVAFHSWAPTLFIRRFGWNIATTGLLYGGCIGLGGVAGILLAGWSAERLAAKGAGDAAPRVAMLAAVAAILPMAMAPLMPTPLLVLAVLLIGMTFLIIPSALAPAVLQSVCPNEIRGQVFGLYMLVMSTIGYAVGPLSVALITDHLLHNEGRLRVSLALVACLCVPASALSLLAARRRFGRLDLGNLTTASLGLARDHNPLHPTSAHQR